MDGPREEGTIEWTVCSQQGTCLYVVCQMASYSHQSANKQNHTRDITGIAKENQKETGWDCEKKGGRIST